MHEEHPQTRIPQLVPELLHSLLANAIVADVQELQFVVDSQDISQLERSAVANAAVVDLQSFKFESGVIEE